jgi:hypothetical protein
MPDTAIVVTLISTTGGIVTAYFSYLAHKRAAEIARAAVPEPKKKRRQRKRKGVSPQPPPS